MTDRFPSARRLAAALVVTLAGSASAAAERMPRVELSGFGTLGYAVLDDPDAEYRSGSAQDGADGDGSFELDSRLGLQLDAQARPGLTGTLQVVGREGPDGDAEAELEWAFVRWHANDWLALRAGRLALPAFAVSDFREVGYANNLLRPPEDLYVTVPFRRFDGIDLNAIGELGETLWSVQLYSGRLEEKFYDGQEVDADNGLGANIAFERGPARIRLSHFSSRVDIYAPDLARLREAVAMATPVAPQLAAVADDLDEERTSMRFSALGLALDFERVFVDAELAYRRLGRSIFDADSWYVAAGFRHENLTPYAFVSEYDENREILESALPPVDALAPLAAALDSFYRNLRQSTVGLGMRWDLAANIALKGQVERVTSETVGVSLSRGSNPPEAADSGDVTLYSIVFDFVF